MPALRGVYAERGREMRGRFAAEGAASAVVDFSVVDEAVDWALFWRGREGEDAFERESRSLWNLRLVVLRAVGIMAWMMIRSGVRRE